MRYRALSMDGDYTFGRGGDNFHVDSPDAVAQAVLTRLRLHTGEWFLNTAEGTPYLENVLGTHKFSTYDWSIRRRVLDTPGVTEIVTFSATVDPVTRKATISGEINTRYGRATLSGVV